MSSHTLASYNKLQCSTSKMSSHTLASYNKLQCSTCKTSSDTLASYNKLQCSTSKMSNDTLASYNKLQCSTSKMSSDTLASYNKLQCSTSKMSNDTLASYNKLAERIQKFHTINMMPISVNIYDIAGDMELGQSLYMNSAKFHKSCKLKFCQVKLGRAMNNHNKPSPSDNPIVHKQPPNRYAFSVTYLMMVIKSLCILSNPSASLTVVRCANILEDSFLQAKLQGGDLIAKDAMYHRVCLTNLYSKASSVQLEGNFNDDERKLHGIAFGEVVSFIEEAVMNAEDKMPAFKLSDLVKLYDARIRNYSRNKNT